jgi:predicted enzyme related to lactoylglutathione lyase
MAGELKPPVGAIGWCDLTVPDADAVRDFYSEVVGFTVEGFDMGGYSDYVLQQPESSAPAAGVCWARGANAGLPAVWLVYFVVESLDRSLARVKSSGGTVLRAPTRGGNGVYAVVRDPAGAVCALFEPAG